MAQQLQTADGQAVDNVNGLPIRQTNAYDPIDDMTKVKSMQQKWRAGFTGTALNPNKWDVLQVGEGQSIAILNGEMSINAGVIPNAETILVSKAEFTIPFRAMMHIKLSQRIANQEFYMEMVSTDKETGELTSDSRAGWMFDGISATTAKYLVNGGDQPILTSAASTVATTATGSIFEIEPTNDEAWFFNRLADSVNGRSASYVRHTQIPNPNLKYKLQIRVKNLAVAPASNTIFSTQFAGVSDYAELTAEITAGRGSAAAGQAIATMPAGGTISTVSTVTAVTTGYVVPKSIRYSETIANIAAAGVFLGTARDIGTTALYSTYRVRVVANQPIKLEVLVGTSATLASNRVQYTEDIPANVVRVIDIPLVAQYAGVRLTNTGAAATTSIEVLSMLYGSL